MKYYGFKDLGNGRFRRKTKEVDITVTLNRTIIDRNIIKVEGVGDLSHHLVEDTAILLNKIAEKICGHKVV
jgi:imidazoleglycerol phosphate dehydratase HisB